MAIIKNYYSPQQIEFHFELVKSDSLIYECNQPDYLNWFPCDFKLYVEGKEYSFLENPILSLEGLKNFINIFRDVLKEKENKSFEYCAAEGEFTVVLMNAEDYFKEGSVEITIWLNASYYKGDSVGYYQGFRFFVSINELKVFYMTLQRQLDQILLDVNLRKGK